MVKKKDIAQTDDMVTVTDAAKHRGVSRTRIHQWIGEGRLKKEERYGRTVVSLAEVMALEELKRGPKASKKPGKKGGKR